MLFFQPGRLFRHNASSIEAQLGIAMALEEAPSCSWDEVPNVGLSIAEIPKSSRVSPRLNWSPLLFMIISVASPKPRSTSWLKERTPHLPLDNTQDHSS